MTCSYELQATNAKMISKWPRVVFTRSPEKAMPVFTSDDLIFHKVWLKLDEKWGSSSPLKVLIPGILQNVPNDPKLNSKNHTWNLPHICSSLAASPKFSSVSPALQSAVFKILHISYWFICFKVAQKIKNCQEKKCLVSHHDSRCPHKLGLRSDENGWKL